MWHTPLVHVLCGVNIDLLSFSEQSEFLKTEMYRKKERKWNNILCEIIVVLIDKWNHFEKKRKV